jgi:1-deoxy-D-xylulose-5-phosphate synthase
MVVSAPMNESELRNLMYTGMKAERPFTIRYPRGEGVLANWKTPFESIEVGSGRKLRDGGELAFLTIGHVGNYGLEACGRLAGEGIDAAMYDMRFVKPLDETLLHDIFKNHKYIITVEDGCLMGGFGTAIAEFMIDHDYHSTIVRLGIPDRLVEHGTQPELHKECGFDVDGLYNAALKIMNTQLV